MNTWIVDATVTYGKWFCNSIVPRVSWYAVISRIYYPVTSWLLYYWLVTSRHVFLQVVKNTPSPDEWGRLPVLTYCVTSRFPAVLDWYRVQFFARGWRFGESYLGWPEGLTSHYYFLVTLCSSLHCNFHCASGKLRSSANRQSERWKNLYTTRFVGLICVLVTFQLLQFGTFL